MSYNIDTWKTKRLEGLEIPYLEFFRSLRKDWRPKAQVNNPLNPKIIKLHFGDGSHITGELDEASLRVSEISIHGEGSGFSMDKIIEPALKKSKGTLVASCVWEGGDTINQIQVKDGNVKWVDIDI